MSAELRALAELSRRVDGLASLIEAQIVPLIRAVDWLADDTEPVRPEPRPRHLRVVRDGER